MLLIFLLATTPFLADKVEIIRQNGESIIHLTGNVVIEDENTKITCVEAELYEIRNVIVLNQDVKIIDPNGEINANSATYEITHRRGHLSGDVALYTENKSISSDSLFYDGINDSIEMFSNVKIEDPDNNLIAYSQRGWYDLEKEEGHLIDNPNLEIAREDKAPIMISAKEFELIAPKNMLFGFDSVIAIIDSVTMYCDTFSYNLKTESGDLVKPIIIEKNNELRGQTGQFQLRDKDIETFSVEQGWSKYYTDKGSENIVEGSRISVIFKQGKASKIVVEGEPKGTLNLKKGGEAEDVGD